MAEATRMFQKGLDYSEVKLAKWGKLDYSISLSLIFFNYL